MIVKRGDVFTCCLCQVDTIAIPDDADLDALFEMSHDPDGSELEEIELLCPACSASFIRDGDYIRPIEN